VGEWGALLIANQQKAPIFVIVKHFRSYQKFLQLKKVFKHGALFLKESLVSFLNNFLGHLTVLD